MLARAEEALPVGSKLTSRFIGVASRALFQTGENNDSGEGGDRHRFDERHRPRGGARAGEGAGVVLNGFGNADGIERLRAEMTREHGVPVEYSSADMSRPAEIAGLVEQTESRLGSVDIVVNNAGVQHVAAVNDFPPEKWDRILAINPRRTFT